MFTPEELRVKIKGKRPLVVCNPANIEVLQAVEKAFNEGIIFPTLVGNKSEITKIAAANHIDLKGMDFIDESDHTEIIKKACEVARPDDAILMKGLIDSSEFLSGVLKRDNGINLGKLTSHVSYFDIPDRKPIVITDSAINIFPDLEKKVKIINNAVEFTRKLGENLPKVACCSAIEKVNTAMPSTQDAAILTMMNKRNQIKDCIVEGPLGLDNAVSKRSAEIKGITGEVAGNADIILGSNIESTNYLYKSLAFLGNASVGGLVWGTRIPVILNSRADSAKSKYLSILLAFNV